MINESTVAKTVNCTTDNAEYFLGYLGGSLILNNLDFNSFIDAGASRYISITVSMKRFILYLVRQVLY